jgi:hypothetical protein
MIGRGLRLLCRENFTLINTLTFVRMAHKDMRRSSDCNQWRVPCRQTTGSTYHER